MIFGVSFGCLRTQKNLVAFFNKILVILKTNA